MPHEHHGDCCEPLAAHDHEHTDHHQALELLSQACCSGACSHTEHMPEAPGRIEQPFVAPHMTQFELTLANHDKKSKKKKKRRLGSLGLLLAEAA